MSFLLLLLLIFFGSLLAGLVPFVLQVSERQLGVLSGFGAGLLVSTALAVVIPEGFSAFEEAQKAAEDRVPHGSMGFVLVAGFAAMLVLDHLQGASGHIHHSNPEEDGLQDPERVVLTRATSHNPPRKKANPASKAFIGLLIHSLADGVAVGTTALTSGKESLKMVVALAMVLHKVPATFGLVAFLISSKWRPSRVRSALLVFAASAPLMALLTYFLLAGIPVLSSDVAVALWLTASGGTFLYAACMHVLPHVATTDHILTNGQLLAILAGCVVPVGIQSVHVHQH